MKGRSNIITTALAGLVAGLSVARWIRKARKRANSTTPGATTVEADLIDIKGIGPVYRQRLAKAGIDSFDELVEAGAAKVATVTGVDEAAAADWIAQAITLAASS
ncbi:MAG TPA: helix-hairpin-helix domain-containing protein [Acidimicrobiia bacterium]|nr:helix-hairpin-helix domain-containing protein [Acidimicrobiia bacterium]